MVHINCLFTFVPKFVEEPDNRSICPGSGKVIV